MLGTDVAIEGTHAEHGSIPALAAHQPLSSGQHSPCASVRQQFRCPVQLDGHDNFGVGGLPPEDASATLQKLLAQRLAPWLRRSANDNQVKPTYVWALEAPHGVVSAHLLIHLPTPLSEDFGDRVLRWLEGLIGSGVPRRAVDIRPIRTLVGVTRYLLKGINDVWGPHLEIRPIPQGEIIGKRSGFSRNLGPAARKRGGYKAKRYIV